MSDRTGQGQEDRQKKQGETRLVREGIQIRKTDTGQVHTQAHVPGRTGPGSQVSAEGRIEQRLVGLTGASEGI